MNERPRRGFASMDQERQRQIASKGGKAAHIKGRAHEFTPEQARDAGRKGGVTVSQDRRHMAQIGRKGGEAVSGDRAHMAEIGREGGHRRQTQRHDDSLDDSHDDSSSTAADEPESQPYTENPADHHAPH